VSIGVGDGYRIWAPWPAFTDLSPSDTEPLAYRSSPANITFKIRRSINRHSWD
jgi:hypothetical protein